MKWWEPFFLTNILRIQTVIRTLCFKCSTYIPQVSFIPNSQNRSSLKFGLKTKATARIKFGGLKKLELGILTRG